MSNVTSTWMPLEGKLNGTESLDVRYCVRGVRIWRQSLTRVGEASGWPCYQPRPRWRLSLEQCRWPWKLSMFPECTLFEPLIRSKQTIIISIVSECKFLTWRSTQRSTTTVTVRLIVTWSVSPDRVPACSSEYPNSRLQVRGFLTFTHRGAWKYGY